METLHYSTYNKSWIMETLHYFVYNKSWIIDTFHYSIYDKSWIMNALHYSTKQNCITNLNCNIFFFLALHRVDSKTKKHSIVLYKFSCKNDTTFFLTIYSKM